MKTVGWINQSQGSIQDSDVENIVAALNMQAPDIAKAWGGDGYQNVVTDANSVPAGALKAYFLPSADVAGALAYHDVDPQGDPYIRVFTQTILQNGGGILSGGASVSSAAAHEFAELWGDPGCQLNSTAPDGKVWALENCDPVESSSYNVTIAGGIVVAVSNFVYPSFFQTTGTAPYDHNGVISKPFTIASGGYAIINNQSVFGMDYPEWRKSDKTSHVSRTWRRTHQGSWWKRTFG